MVARGPRRQRAAVHRLHQQRQRDQDARRRDGRDRDEAPGRPHDRRPLHLHPPRAHLGQGAGRRADRRVPARDPPGRQRALHRHRVRARANRPDGAQPGVAGRGARLRRGPVHPLREPGRGRARARRSARSTSSPEVEPATFERLGEQEGIETINSPTYAFTELVLQPLLRGGLPGGEVQPGGAGPDDPPGDRLRDRPRADQRDRHPGHGVRRPRPAAVVLQGLLRGARAGLPLRPGDGEPDPRRGGLGAERRRHPREGRRGRLVRPLRALGVAVHGPDGEADRRADRRRSGSSSTSRS